MRSRIYLYLIEVIITIAIVLLLIVAMKPVVERMANSRGAEADVVQEFYGGGQ